LNAAQIGDLRRVQFRCTQCGKPTLVELERRPDSTQVVSPLPAFARGAGAPRRISAYEEPDSDLRLPPGKAISITVIGGASRGSVYPLEKPRIIVGRTGTDVPLDDAGVSRRHCMIEIRGDVVRLCDLDSTNGTYLAEERTRAAQLRHMSEFRIGSSVLLLTIRSRLDP
jgi:type III secretion system (T3SS) inner membrane Yop/YscD-like protein